MAKPQIDTGRQGWPPSNAGSAFHKTLARIWYLKPRDIPTVLFRGGGAPRSPGVSGALVCQIDLLASFAALTGQKLADADAPDSFNVLPALLGESKTGRERLVEDAQNRLALREGEWKVIEGGRPRNRNAGSGSAAAEQLYNLGEDLGETKDLGAQNPEKVKEAIGRLEKMRQNRRSRP